MALRRRAGLAALAALSLALPAAAAASLDKIAGKETGPGAQPDPPLAAIPPGLPGWAGMLAGLGAALDGPGLIQSYAVRARGEAGYAPFDRVHGNCAYVYDNAVAGLALLACGERGLALRIGTALLHAQSHDRFWADGRLRNAYRAGPLPPAGPYPLAGWWDDAARRWAEDPYQAGSATGVMAWAMLLWLALARAQAEPLLPGLPGFAAAARLTASLISRRLTAPAGFYGGFSGFEPDPPRLDWISTEHAADLAAVFHALGDAAAAAHARRFLDSMFDPAQGGFAAGLTPQGARFGLAAVDANLWPALLPGADPRWAAGLGFVLARCGAAAGDGVGFSAASQGGLWLEGTAMAALAARRAGDGALAARLLGTLARYTAGGMIYATPAPLLRTGLATGTSAGPDAADDFVYYGRPHLAPLAWAVLAAQGANPYTL